jgi:hypothetical protein
MTEKVFEIDYERLALLLLPTFLRREVTAALLWAVTSPVVTTYDAFVSNRKSNLQKLKMNGQVCYLRRLLNDAFPEADGAIRIGSGNRSTGRWQLAWDKDYDPYMRYLLIADGGTMLYDKDTTAQSVNGFTVSVPRALKSVDNDAKLRSLLNTYKLASKHYTIIYE